MPNYEYECQNCQHTLEVHQSFADAPLTLCPKCNQDKLMRCIGVPIMAKVVTPRTLGTLAERNARGMSTEEKDRIREQEKTQKTIDRIGLPQKPKEKKGPKPWYEKFRKATTKEINKMTPVQRHKYIMTGEKS